MHETAEERIRRLSSEDIAIVPYDSCWPRLFAQERLLLTNWFGPHLIGRIEHFGSTAVPGMAAKPVIDMLIEVMSLERVRAEIVPVLKKNGYEYLWRPTHGDDGEPHYAWFIKRDADGRRTHHLHMVEPHFDEHWRRLEFRDFLIAHPRQAREYERLKRRLARAHSQDRAAYTRGKTAFIEETMAAAARKRKTVR
jgi:GrpB-like predicted nucleotidyltransferase (UPF0157 family)